MIYKNRVVIAIISVLILIGGLLTGIIYNGNNSDKSEKQAKANEVTIQAAQNSIGVDKKGYDVSTNSTTGVKTGNAVNWVMSYKNNTGSLQDSVVINDSVPANTKFVGGSLSAAPDFLKKYSTNNAGTFAATEPNPASTVTDVQVTGNNIPSPATGIVQTFGTPVLQATGTSTTTGGDGYKPIFVDYTDSSGNPATRIFAIYHHWGPAPGITHRGNINCVQFLGGGVASGSICPGYPRYFSSDSNSNGIPDPNPAATPPNGVADISTSWIQSDGYVRNNKIYYLGQRANDFGLGCFDPIADKNCGYTLMGNLGNDINAANGMSAVGSMLTNGDKVFVPASDGQMYCINISNLTSCATFPKAINGVPNAYFKDGTTYSAYLSLANKFQNKAFVLLHKHTSNIGYSSPAYLICFDIETQQACTGWTSPVQLPYTNELSTPMITLKKANSTDQVANIIDKVCYRSSLENITTPTLTCLNTTDQSATTNPPGLEATLPLGRNGFDGNDNVANRFSYTSVWKGLGLPVDTVNGTGFIACYDWVLSAPCATFNGGGKYFNVGGTNNLRIYTTNYYKGCLYALGDAGILWSVDPITAASPCQTASASTSVSPLTNFYCDGKTRTLSYDKIQFYDLTGVGVGSGIDGITSEIKDAKGTFIKSVNIQNGIGDISDIPYGSNVNFGDILGLDTTTLKVESYAYGNTTILATMAGKKVGIFFNSPDAPQICFKTQVDLLATPNTNITNTVSGSSIFAQPSLSYTIGILPGLIPNCPTTTNNTVSTCTFTLPTGNTLPTGFKLSIGNGPTDAGGTTPAQNCTVGALNLVTCTNVPTGNSIGNVPIYGSAGTTKTNSGTKTLVNGTNFGAVNWVFTPTQGANAPLFRSVDNVGITITNFRSIYDLTPNSNTRYTCKLEYKNLSDRNGTTPVWNSLSASQVSYNTTTGCTFSLTKQQRASVLNHALKLTITDTTITTPSTTNPNTYTFYNEYIYRFQGAGTASGG